MNIEHSGKFGARMTGNIVGMHTADAATAEHGDSGQFSPPDFLLAMIFAGGFYCQQRFYKVLDKAPGEVRKMAATTVRLAMAHAVARHLRFRFTEIDGGRVSLRRRHSGIAP